MLKCVQDYIVPMKQKITWGYDIPYMLTGQLNQHPKPAISFMANGDSENYTKFYDSLLEND